MSIDSGALLPNSSCIPTSSSLHPNKTLGSTDNLKGIIKLNSFEILKTILIDNRGYAINQDDTLTSVLSTLAGTFKDITESPYFPKMTFKRIPSSKNPTSIFSKTQSCFF
jgi:hypothetical protein